MTRAALPCPAPAWVRFQPKWWILLKESVLKQVQWTSESPLTGGAVRFLVSN